MISALLLSLASLAASPDAGVAVAAPLPVSVIWNWRSNAPRVRVWLEDDRTFRRGDRARVSFRTEEDAYVTVVRIDTDGRMRIIYPERPSYEHRVAGGRIYSVDGVSDGSFRIDDGAGMGYIFAIASWDRFDFERAYDSPFHQVGYRVRGDPYEAVSSLAEEMLPYRDALYSTHAAEYYVDNHRDYPRYSCNECHFGGSHPGHWHPHLHTCPFIRLVIFGGHHHHHYPDYYPYYYYHGHRRVYVRQHRYRPQYEFKEVARGERVNGNDGFIERRTRQVAVDNRRPGSPATDPNIDRRRGGGVAPGAGATRPGGSSGDEAATVGTMPGRRRGQEADGPGNSNNAPGRTGDTPRRAVGDAADSPGNSGSAPGRAGAVPRRVEGTTNAEPERDRGTTIDGDRPRRSADPGSDDRGPIADERPRDDIIERSSSDPRREPPRRGDSGSRLERDDEDDLRGEAREPRGEPRRSDERSTEQRGSDERRAEPRESRPEPRDEPRRAEPRDEPRRSETREEPRRSEPRSEPRRSEPRSEPKRETRSEPKARSTETRSSEPRRSSGSSSRPSSSSPRRRP